MKHNLLLIVNKPSQPAAVTTQEYDSLEAAMNAREIILAHSRQSTVYTIFALVTEKGKASL